MTWQVHFEAAAQAEIAEAFDWYEQQSYGLGGDFLRVIAAAEEQLTRNPEAFPPTRNRFRRILLRRFPYALHFELLDELVQHQPATALDVELAGQFASENDFAVAIPEGGRTGEHECRDRRQREAIRSSLLRLAE